MDEVFARLSSGMTLLDICDQNPHLPSAPTIRRHCRHDDGLMRRYNDARNMGLDTMAEELLRIADDADKDVFAVETSKGETNYVSNPNAIARARLRTDVRKWYLSKLAPRRYGDAVKLEHTGAGGGPIQQANLSDAQIAQALNALNKAKITPQQAGEDDDGSDLV